MLVSTIATQWLQALILGYSDGFTRAVLVALRLALGRRARIEPGHVEESEHVRTLFGRFITSALKISPHFDQVAPVAVSKLLGEVVLFWYYCDEMHSQKRKRRQ